MDGLHENLDLMGEQPALFKLYTQLSLVYLMNEDISRTQVIDTVQDGLKTLSRVFPWIAGQVVDEGQDGKNVYKIIPLDETPRLTAKNYDDDARLPTMDALRTANFPFSMLDEGIITPCNTLAGLGFDPTARSGAGEAPVLLVQINFIEGGLILTFNAQHNCMDMTGQAQVMALLSKACRGEEFTEEEVRIGNLARRDVVPIIDNYTPGPELDRQMVKAAIGDETVAAESAALPPQPPPPLPPKCEWVYITFSPVSLLRLKERAIQTLPVDVSYITTDDALTAFVWQSILRARSSRLSPDQSVTIARAVDARRYLNVDATYPGLLQNMTYHTHTLSDLVALPLGGIAAELRQAVDMKSSDIAFRTKSLVSFLGADPANQARASFTANMDMSVDIALSSWAKISAYGLDFGLGLGKPEAVRRPAFVPVEGLIYLMPKRGDGEVAIGMCLREGDLQRLKRDERFMEAVEFVG